MKRPKTPDGARVFNVRLVVVESGPESSVEVWEDGAKTRTFNDLIPAGELAVREGLIIAGNQVRTAYRNRQRELELRERQDRATKNRAEVAAARLEARKAAAAKGESHVRGT